MRIPEPDVRGVRLEDVDDEPVRFFLTGFCRVSPRERPPRWLRGGSVGTHLPRVLTVV